MPSNILYIVYYAPLAHEVYLKKKPNKKKIEKLAAKYNWKCSHYDEQKKEWADSEFLMKDVAIEKVKFEPLGL